MSQESEGLVSLSSQCASKAFRRSNCPLQSVPSGTTKLPKLLQANRGYQAVVVTDVVMVVVCEEVRVVVCDDVRLVLCEEVRLVVTVEVTVVVAEEVRVDVPVVVGV